MKTSDEIKEGLKQCSIPRENCDCCPYKRDYEDFSICITDMCADALAYIQKLENESNSMGDKNAIQNHIRRPTMDGTRWRQD